MWSVLKATCCGSPGRSKTGGATFSGTQMGPATAAKPEGEGVRAGFRRSPSFAWSAASQDSEVRCHHANDLVATVD